MPAKTISQLTQATTINGTDDFAIEQAGVTKRIAASVVRGDIIDANIKSDAAIAYSKLAALNSAQILVGNGSNVPTAVSVTGDVTISNAGVTAIGSAKVLPAMLSQPYTLATAQNSTSGTSIDFTGIPSWAKRITVMFNGVSTSGTSVPLIRLGDAGGFETTGYTSVTTGASTTSDQSRGGSSTDGFRIAVSAHTAADSIVGAVQIVNISGNSWVCSGSLILNGVYAASTAGSKTLSEALTQLRVTTAGGTETFDAGSINIAYEG